MIAEIESEWRETGIPCPACGAMTYSDGKHRPQCGDRPCDGNGVGYNGAPGHPRYLAGDPGRG